MQFRVEFSLDTAAYALDDNGADFNREAVAETLRDLAEIVIHQEAGTIFDVNGNAVGRFAVR